MKSEEKVIIIGLKSCKDYNGFNLVSNCVFFRIPFSGERERKRKREKDNRGG